MRGKNREWGREEEEYRDQREGRRKERGEGKEESERRGVGWVLIKMIRKSKKKLLVQNNNKGLRNYLKCLSPFYDLLSELCSDAGKNHTAL